MADYFLYSELPNDGTWTIGVATGSGSGNVKGTQAAIDPTAFVESRAFTACDRPTLDESEVHYLVAVKDAGGNTTGYTELKQWAHHRDYYMRFHESLSVNRRQLELDSPHFGVSHDIPDCELLPPMHELLLEQITLAKQAADDPALDALLEPYRDLERPYESHLPPTRPMVADMEKIVLEAAQGLLAESALEAKIRWPGDVHISATITNPATGKTHSLVYHIQPSVPIRNHIEWFMHAWLFADTTLNMTAVVADPR